jgi:hypothetical protein
VSVDEDVEVDRIEIVPRRIRQPRDIPRRNRLRDPLRVVAALLFRADGADASSDLS